MLLIIDFFDCSIIGNVLFRPETSQASLTVNRAHGIQDIPPGVQDQPRQAALTSRVDEARVLDGNYRGSQESSCTTHVLAGSPETGKPKRLIEFSCSEMLIQTAFNWVLPML